jgi:hypothetical protein
MTLLRRIWEFVTYDPLDDAPVPPPDPHITPLTTRGSSVIALLFAERRARKAFKRWYEKHGGIND